MKKLLFLSFLLFNSLTFSQNFDSYASGIKINNTIYNTSGTGVNQINPNPGAFQFNGVNLGVFGQNSTCARITGGEIKTYKTASGNVCSANLYWRVYPSSGAASGVFNTVPLSTISNCNTTTSIFFDGLGPCASNDQKWKDYTININFISSLIPGNYILEIYYDFKGSDASSSTCETTKFINNSNSNFKGNFTISNPTCNPVVSPTTVCEGDTIQLTSNPTNGVAPYTYSWTGPNGFTSSDANPIVVTTLSSGGIYSLFVTDSCGAISTTQSTNSVSITPKIDPEFEGLNPGLCRFGTPPLLPNLSSNGITGTWNPATVNNATAGIFTYTFTPDVGQCANSFVQTIFVVNNVTPSFTLPTSICAGSTSPTLNTSSNNGITGVWNPTTVSNVTTGTYTFTPNAGQCAVVRTVTINVTPNVTPSFSLPSSLCENSVAPALLLISNNGITGTWNPTSISTTNSGSYTFTPSAGQCATNTTVSITVNPNVTPLFNPIEAICVGAIAPTLPLVSTNGISGTWNPLTVSNTLSGTYTFTPNAGQCALQTSVDITVNPIVTPTFDPISNVCYQSTPPLLSSLSNNGISGTWNPSTVSATVSGTYTFTPNVGECAITTSISVIVDVINPIFNTIAPICENEIPPTLPMTSNNGITGTWNPSIVSNTTSGTYTFTPDTGQCATTTTLNVIVNPNITPTFNTIAPICENATIPTLSLTSNNGITGTWNPSIISNTNSDIYTFTPDIGQCATIATLNVIVNPNITPTFDTIASICSGTVAPTLPLTSNNGITGTWNPSIVSNTTSGTYTFTPQASQCATNTSIDIIVIPNVIPTFDDIVPICSGTIAPTLPMTSNNGISGTWNPSIVSNTASGTYTFTPEANQCATTALLNVIVNPNILPTFDTIPSVCYQSTAPILPLSSTNGISGTWNPSIVSNTTSGIYTFTPDAGQCATITSVAINVNIITPTFDLISDVCYESTAPLLPSVSNNGIIGTWNPSIVSNTTSGTYTFTPDSGQCATSVSITTNIILVTPSFDITTNICYGSASPILSTTSINGISGTWNPSIVSNTNPDTYTFTPNTGQCAIEVSISISINAITPLFDAILPICENEIAPTLPLTSTNGITGTWNPSIINNTTSGNYTFTPDAGQCATSVIISTTIIPNIIPVFDAFAAVCYLSTSPTLPLLSNNGITGTWNPSIVSNTNTGIYTFTPDAGQCATTTTVTINVTTITPTFDLIADVCYESTAPLLPTVSNNGITGTWNPSTVSNTISGTYIFTPDSDQCALEALVTININVVTPLFDTILPICENENAPTLPLTSTNGVTGTWNPSTVSNTVSGTYLFTPNSGQCALNQTISIIVNPNTTPTFDIITDVCFGDLAPTLPLTSTEGISGTWNPSIVSNINSGTYTFTPNSGQCATTTTITINVNSINPIFDEIASICENTVAPTLPLLSTNGITGTWNPSIISNTNSGTYIFTPNVGQCATAVTISINVVPIIIPTFDSISDVCYQSESPLLPLISNNGIAGTWNPATISNTNSGTYTFTPNVGQCAQNNVITINVNTITPTFDTIGSVCYNAVAPTLPTTSNNGISGTWNPSTVSNTNSGTYTFTPNIGQCATVTNLTIDVNIITPTFNLLTSICENSIAPILPTTSNNGIIGTWNPAIISNTNSGTYTFTPNVGQCATVVIINFTVIPNAIPTFNSIAPICENSIAPILPTISNNGIIGTWNSPVSNTTSGTYVFIPNAGQCASTTSLSVIVNPNIIPVFASIAPICSGSTAPILPLTSINGISGTWNSIINTTSSGTYTFTPNEGQCATTTTLNVIVNSPPTDLDLITSNVFNESATGSITINGVSEGSSPFTYSINGSDFTNLTNYSNLSPGEYTIIVKDANGCEYLETVSIISNCIIPKGISPNDDGKNDRFNLVGCNIKKLGIFNRYGVKVNSFENYTDEWFGRASNGNDLPDGTYYYAVEFSDGTTKTGWIYITR